MIKAVIFDFDGLLADSEPTHFKAWKNSLAKYGAELKSREDYQEYYGRTEDEIAEFFTKKFNLTISDKKLLDEKSEEFHNLLKEIPLMPGVEKRIQEAKDNNIKIAMASCGNLAYVATILKNHNIFTEFSHVVTAEDVSRGKPDPEIFLKTCKLIEEDPSDCAVLEDSPNGCLAAMRAGCITVAVPNNQIEGLEYPQTHYAISNLLELKLIEISLDIKVKSR